MRIFLVLFLVHFFVPSVYAQNNQSESLTISTYYPAPYGVYRNLKLNPSPVPNDSSVSTGVIYYDQSQNVLRYHNKTEWVNVTGGGGSSGWAMIKITCPWGSDYTAGANSGWGNQCGLPPNYPGCCRPSNCPSGWDDAGTGIQLTGVSCPKHFYVEDPPEPSPPANVIGGCTWNSADACFHPVAVGNVVRTCVKKGATVMTNSTTWWSDGEMRKVPPYMGWGDQCVNPTSNRCWTEDIAAPLKVEPTCPAGWTMIARNITVNQVSCFHNQEDSGHGCNWDESWTGAHPLANGEIVATCEKNN